MIVNKCYETMIVLYLSTILTEKRLKNMKIKPELTGNRVLECLKLNRERRRTPAEPTPSAAPMSMSFLRACIVYLTQVETRLCNKRLFILTYKVYCVVQYMTHLQT